jgi:hypothetical protein
MSRAQKITELFRREKNPSAEGELQIWVWDDPHIAHPKKMRAVAIGTGQGGDYTMAEVNKSMPGMVQKFKSEAKKIPGQPIHVYLDLAHGKDKVAFTSWLKRFHGQIGRKEWTMGSVNMEDSYANEGPDEYMIGAVFTPKG